MLQLTNTVFLLLLLFASTWTNAGSIKADAFYEGQASVLLPHCQIGFIVEAELVRVPSPSSLGNNVGIIWWEQKMSCRFVIFRVTLKPSNIS